MANSNFAFDFDMFEQYESAVPASAAPVKKEAPKKPSRLTLVEETPATSRQRRVNEEKRSFISTMLMICASFALIALLGTHIYQRVMINTYDHKIAAMEKKLEEARSQNTVLNIKKDSMISADSIRDTADKLGMIRRDRYQITYFDLSGDDYGVVIS